MALLNVIAGHYCEAKKTAGKNRFAQRKNCFGGISISLKRQSSENEAPMTYGPHKKTEGLKKLIFFTKLNFANRIHFSIFDSFLKKQGFSSGIIG